MSIHPGGQKYEPVGAQPHELGSDAALRGDAVAIGADGSAVTTTGSNGFLGVLATPTAADADAGNLPNGHSQVGSGDRVTVSTHGVVRAKVSAAVGGSVSAGDALEAGANGALVNVDDGTGAAVQAGPGDVQAVEDEDSEGFALALLR